ncbi:MAG: GNAT family N-acetyltransferase [Candidatus Bathyarchaeia archaeon]|jgi:CelD/BcsL family acetyltransferase involved in cellulose biosynthesis
MAILEFQRIDEINDFEREWNQLLAQSLDNNPFLTYEWLTTWWKHFGEGRELKLFTAESQGAVSLVIPVMYTRSKVFGSRRCKVEFVASGDSDYQGFLVTNFQKAARTVNELLESIIEDSNDADRVIFGEVPEDSFTARLLEGVSGEGFGASHSTASSCPYVSLPSNYDGYRQTLGSNMRRKLKVWEKQASKDYRVEFIRYDKIGTVKEAMKIFFELHQKRQMAKGNCGVFHDSDKRSFHMDIANAFAEKGWLGLFFLTFNDRPVSAIYSFEYNAKLYAYLCGFDPEYARYRPGHLAFANLIKYGVGKKLKELDFLRGDEEYKSRWRAMVRNNFEFRISKRGLKSKVYNWTTDNGSFSYLHKIPVLSQRFFAKVH